MRNMIQWIGVGLAGLLLLQGTIGWVQPAMGGPGEAIEPGPGGLVNWGSRIVRAKGVGVPPATSLTLAQARALAAEAAEVLARRNLLAVVRGMAIDSQQTVESAMMTSSLTQARVSGFIRGAQVVETRELPDGRVEVEVEMALTGEFSDLLLTRPAISSPTPPAPQPSEASSVRPIYTGLVVDARGLNARPAMAPRIVSESGQEIYGSAIVDREWAVRHGMAGYSKDLIAAQSHERVVDRPLTVKGLKADGLNRSDIVISNAEAQMLLSAGQHLSFLEKARVVIVVD